jgi:hypothetical protein
VYILLCCSHLIRHLTNWCTKTKNLFDCSGNHSRSFSWSCPLPTCWPIYMLLCCSHLIQHLTNWCTKTKNLFDCSGNDSRSFSWSCPLPTCWPIYITTWHTTQVFFCQGSHRETPLHIHTEYSRQNCALLSYYTASSDNFLRTFQNNLSIPSWFLEVGPIGYSESSVRNYNYLLRNNPEERSSHLLRCGSLKSCKEYSSPFPTAEDTYMKTV